MRKYQLFLKSSLVVLLLLLLSSCGSASATDKNVDSIGEVNKKLMGFWHAMPSVAAGYEACYSFSGDGKYIYYPNNEENNYWKGVTGKWSIKDSVLNLKSDSSTEMISLKLGEVIKAEDSPYEWKVNIGENDFWKISDDPNWDEFKDNVINGSPSITTENDKMNTQSNKKITPEEAKNLILKFRSYKINELSLDRIDKATGDYYITREPGSSKGNAGITYRINPITGDVYNDINNELEFNLFKIGEASQGTVSSKHQTEEIDNSLIQENELIKLLGLEKEKVLDKLGDKYEMIPTGPDGSNDGYAYKSLGLIVVFKTDKVDYIACSSKINIKGIDAGMKYEAVKKILGNNEIEETWYENPDNKIFEMRYDYDNYTIRLFSNSKQGTGATLWLINNAK